MQIQYLNTDLDLSAAVDLTQLAAAFDTKGVFPLVVEQLENGSWFARFEVVGENDAPESNIATMLSVIEKLNESERNTWQSLTGCEFNIGYDCGSEPWAFNQGLSNALLSRIAQVGASLRITLYPPESSREKSQPQQASESSVEAI